MTQVRLLLALMLATSVLFTAPAPVASAETASYGDLAEDVGHGMDIRRVRVRNEGRLVVTIRHEALQDDGSVGVYIDVTPHRNSTPDYRVSMNMFDGRWFEWMSTWGRPGGRVRCDFRAQTDFTRSITRFSISQLCLSGASFEATTVRVSAVAGVADGPADWAPGAYAWSQWVRKG